MLRVLLVDDEPIVKAALRKIIPWEEEGFEIVGTAGNGQEALRLLLHAPADVIITDLKMPQMDGISLIKALGEAGFDGVILVLSNYSDFELVREALVEGAIDYMLKVNINAANLTEQLQRARDTLVERRRHRQKEQLATWHGVLLRAQDLRAYLETEEEGIQPSPALVDAYAKGPFAIFQIIFLPQNPRTAVHMPSAPHVEAVLRSVLEEVRDVEILILGDRELLCVHPVQGLVEKGIRQEDKLAQIARQIHMYFNTSVLIITPEPALTLSDIRCKHKAMGEAAALSFYAISTTILPPDAVALTAIPAGFSADMTARRLAERYFEQEGEVVWEEIVDFFNVCRASRVHPAEVQGFLIQTAAELAAFAPGSKQVDRTFKETAAWNALQHEQALYTQALTLYERILTQIVPPAFVHCREEVREALRYVHVHYAERITLEDVACAAGLDRSYLCRLFKRETKMNLFAYINGLRMHAAVRLMETGETYIRGIAGRVGIEDPFYFTRLFKKHFGISPSEYRAGHEEA